MAWAHGLGQGLIRGEIEAAAARARRGRGWADGVCDAPHRGECAAGGTGINLAENGLLRKVCEKGANLPYSKRKTFTYV